MSQLRVSELRREIGEYNNAYYGDSEPLVPDSVYDAKVAELRKLEKDLTGNKPEEVAYSKTTFLNMPHKSPMTSLQAATTEEERTKFLQYVNGVDSGMEYCIEYKYDGLAINLIYVKGELVSAATRGDGIAGEDVTRNAFEIMGVPKVLEGVDRGVIEIRGEVVMLKEDFNELNGIQRDLELPEFATPRNAASGTLRQLNPDILKERILTFIPYSQGINTIPHHNEISRQSQYLGWLSKKGFKVPPYSVVTGIESIPELFTTMTLKRSELPYDADGVVIKVNSFNYQAMMGNTGKDPNWASAFKFPNQSATAIIEGVEWGVGRTGVLTPVALLKPISLDGVTIRHATLHNLTFMMELSPKGIIHEGDSVLLERAGGVIPKIVTHLSTNHEGKGLKYPGECPSCGSKVTTQGRDLVCMAGLYCGGQLEAHLLHFASRDRMDIRGLGNSIISQLRNSGLLNDISDLYTLTVERLTTKTSLSPLMATKLVRSIEESRSTTLPRFLASLNIPGVGLSLAERIAKKLIHFENIFQADKETLMSVEGISDRTAIFITDWFAEENNRKLVIKLMLAKRDGGCGIEWAEVDLSRSVKLPLSGMTYAFTGTLSLMGRREAAGLLKALGANIATGISRHVDILIAGDDAGGKIDSAKALGLEIWDESQFIDLIRKYQGAKDDLR